MRLNDYDGRVLIGKCSLLQSGFELLSDLGIDIYGYTIMINGNIYH